MKGCNSVKKYLILLIVVMILGLSACSNNNATETNSSDAKNSISTIKSDEENDETDEEEVSTEEEADTSTSEQDIEVSSSNEVNSVPDTTDALPSVPLEDGSTYFEIEEPDMSFGDGTKQIAAISKYSKEELGLVYETSEYEFYTEGREDVNGIPCLKIGAYYPISENKSSRNDRDYYVTADCSAAYYYDDVNDTYVQLP